MARATRRPAVDAQVVAVPAVDPLAGKIAQRFAQVVVEAVQRADVVGVVVAGVRLVRVAVARGQKVRLAAVRRVGTVPDGAVCHDERAVVVASAAADSSAPGARVRTVHDRIPGGERGVVLSAADRVAPVYVCSHGQRRARVLAVRRVVILGRSADASIGRPAVLEDGLAVRGARDSHGRIRSGASSGIRTSSASAGGAGTPDQDPSRHAQPHPSPQEKRNLHVRYSTPERALVFASICFLSGQTRCLPSANAGGISMAPPAKKSYLPLSTTRLRTFSPRSGVHYATSQSGITACLACCSS